MTSIRALFIMSSLCLGACAPRDVALVTDTERPTISQLGKKSSKNFDRNNSGSLLGNYSLSVQLVERQAEAAQVLFWILNPEKNLKKEIHFQREGDGTSEVKISILGQSLKSAYSNVNLNRTESWQAILKYSDSTERKILQKISLEGASSALITSQQDPEYQIQAQDFDKKLLITPNADGSFRVEYTLTTSLNVKKSKRQETDTLVYNFDFDLIPKSENEFLLKNHVAHLVVNPGNREFSVQLKDNFNLKISECLKLSGSATVLMGKKNPDLIFDEHGIRLSEGKWSSQLADCAIRPIIDFTRVVE